MLPKFIPILGVKIPVELASLEKGCDGEYCTSTRRIRISKTLSPEMQLHVVAHELAHAWLALTGLNQFLTSRLEEAIVLSFETAFGDILVAYLKQLSTPRNKSK